MAARAIGTARDCGCTGTIIVRMDSACYNAAVISAVRRGGARFSVTAPMNAGIRAAIAAIGEGAWTAIRYPHAIWDDQLDAWISDAEVAEAEYTAFASKKGQAVTARLIVRRVRDLNKQAGTGQDELFPVWRYHAVFTDSAFELVQAEEQHRDHAVVEQIFADVTSGPLAHMPGVFAANAAWLSVAAMAHNLVRAAGALASPPFAKARAATIRRDLIAVAARTARRGRGHITLHLPEAWHREQEWVNLLAAVCGPPRSGLTSPGPVSTPDGRHSHPDPSPEPGTQDKPHNRPAAGRPRPESPRKTPRAGIKPETSYRNWPVDRGLDSWSPDCNRSTDIRSRRSRVPSIPVRGLCPAMPVSRSQRRAGSWTAAPDQFHDRDCDGLLGAAHVADTTACVLLACRDWRCWWAGSGGPATAASGWPTTW